MSTIRITRRHKKPLAQARAAVEHIAQSIGRKFDVEYAWNGNTLHFERHGVNGHIALAKGSVTITVELGFLLFAIRAPIEREIERKLDEEFGPAA
jgi:putative polyhydroxyalkanoate system protein